MEKGIVSRLSIVGLILILAAGLLVGCSSGETDSPSTNTSEQHAEQQSEDEHDHDESSHEQEGHHDEEGHHEEMDHNDEDGHEHDHDHERAEHFEGKEAKTYDEAVSNMKSANNKLEERLAKDELSGEDFYKIHRMSYTMENALEVIREESDGDFADIAENLESVHLASEKRDAQTVREDGKQYLKKAKSILKNE